jgi:hypothetical protein
LIDSLFDNILATATTEEKESAGTINQQLGRYMSKVAIGRKQSSLLEWWQNDSADGAIRCGKHYSLPTGASIAPLLDLSSTFQTRTLFGLL